MEGTWPLEPEVMAYYLALPLTTCGSWATYLAFLSLSETEHRNISSDVNFMRHPIAFWGALLENCFLDSGFHYAVCFSEQWQYQGRLSGILEYKDTTGHLEKILKRTLESRN